MKGSTLCIGADVHLKEITFVVVDKADGHAVTERFHVTNNLAGAQAAAEMIAGLARRWGYTRIEIGWESTGMLWIPFHSLSCWPVNRDLLICTTSSQSKTADHPPDCSGQGRLCVSDVDTLSAG